MDLHDGTMASGLIPLLATDDWGDPVCRAEWIRESGFLFDRKRQFELIIPHNFEIFDLYQRFLLSLQYELS